MLSRGSSKKVLSVFQIYSDSDFVIID